MRNANLRNIRGEKAGQSIGNRRDGNPAVDRAEEPTPLFEIVITKTFREVPEDFTESDGAPYPHIRGLRAVQIEHAMQLIE